MWNSASEFLAMGGYALYVWSSFGLCAIAFFIEVLMVRSQRKSILRRLKQALLADQYHQESRQ
ncbi:heme exporter protein CcmD [Polynucleobacter paneuropaeus]|uniref:heme exporter protein CcmD n=1 Tax=Polynucleobacter paludilacus TaxID=1855895 RepID=UPI001BFEAD9B|nr:heme exporter protein CcmD [Polynucleobacter paludilacus]QWC96383.1 heme exporter protein CcmD [Polynucleobacter paneuropaeus]QWD86653.1 heme exporter protein CcmD [Polynucleobacter paludilacus]